MIPHRIDFKKYFINPERQIPRRSSFTDVENVLKAETSTLTLPKRERQCISLPRGQIEETNILESPCSNVNTISNSSSSNDSPESSSLASSQEICVTTASSVTSDASVSTSPVTVENRFFETDRRDPNLSNQKSEMTKQERLIKSNTPEKNKVEEVSKTDNVKQSDSSPHTNSWNERKLRYTTIQEKGEPTIGHKENMNTYEKYPISAASIASSLSNSNENIIKPFHPIPLYRRSNQDARNSPKSMLKATDSPLLQEKCNNKALQQCTYEEEEFYSANMHDKFSSSDTIPIEENKFNINSNQNQVNSPYIRKKEQVVKVRPKPQTRTSVDKLAKNAIIQSNENSLKIKRPGTHSENSLVSDISSKAGSFTPPTPLKQTILKGKLENSPELVSEDFPKTKSFHHSPNDKQYLTVSPNRHFSSDSPSSIPFRNISDARVSRGIVTKPIQEPVILSNKQLLKKLPYPEAAPLKNTRMSTSVPISPVQTPKRVSQTSGLQSEGNKSPINKPEVPCKTSHVINTKGSRIPISKSTRSVASPPKPNRLVMNRLTNPYGGLRPSSDNTSAPRKNLPPSNIENDMHQLYPENLSLVTEHPFQSPPISEVTHKESIMFKKQQNGNEYFESTASDQFPAMTARESTMMNRRIYMDEEETYSSCSMKQTNLDETESSKVSSREEIPKSRNHNSFIRSSSCEVQVGSPTKTSPTTNFAVAIPIEASTETSHTKSRPKMTITETSMHQENYNTIDRNYHDTATLPTGFYMAIEEDRGKHRSFKQDAAAQTSQLDLYEENYNKYFQGGKEILECRQHDAAAQTHLETEVIERSLEENGTDTLMFEFASTSSLTASLPTSARHHIKMGGASLKTRPSSEMVEIKQQKCCKANHFYQNPLESSRSYDQIQQIVFMEEGQARLYDLKPVSCQNVHIISPNNKSYVSSYCSANSQEFPISAEQNVMKPSYIDQSQTVFPRSELKKKLSNSLASGLNESLYSSSDSYIFHSNNSLKETTYSEFEPRRRRTASLSNIEYERRMDCRKNQKRSRISAFFDKFQRKKKPSILANDVDVPTHFRVIGRILEMCLDGTRIIELTQPPHGLCGIYMTRVKHNLGYSIYVSRFSDGYPAKMFAGLLGIGDEILEINGISTGCMTVEDAHDMVASSDKLILRVLPNRNTYRTT
uniref:PDZ domain-containing protein n=2 Tax=Octopus bimaculoides TaxID=37653 RepID=A0A0L8I6Y5_OCTBM